jgi:hypothetical protein
MKSVLNLNGIEIELPEGASVNVSEDGKKVKVQFPENVKEKIRVVEIPGPERVVEKIQFIEKYLPCSLQHYPSYSPCTLPHYPIYTYPYPWHYPWYYSGNISVSGGIDYSKYTGGITNDNITTSTVTVTPSDGYTYYNGYQT